MRQQGSLQLYVQCMITGKHWVRLTSLQVMQQWVSKWRHDVHVQATAVQ
jgi:hypothetical protein